MCSVIEKKVVNEGAVIRLTSLWCCILVSLKSSSERSRSRPRTDSTIILLSLLPLFTFFSRIINDQGTFSLPLLFILFIKRFFDTLSSERDAVIKFWNAVSKVCISADDELKVLNHVSHVQIIIKVWNFSVWKLDLYSLLYQKYSSQLGLRNISATFACIDDTRGSRVQSGIFWFEKSWIDKTNR